jgi:hypothetical protein
MEANPGADVEATPAPGTFPALAALPNPDNDNVEPPPPAVPGPSVPIGSAAMDADASSEGGFPTHNVRVLIRNESLTFLSWPACYRQE